LIYKPQIFMKKLERMDGKLFSTMEPLTLGVLSKLNGGYYATSGVYYDNGGRHTYTDKRDGQWQGQPPVWVWVGEKYDIVYGSIPYDPYGDDGGNYEFALADDQNWYHQ